MTTLIDGGEPVTGDHRADFATQLEHVSCGSLVDAMGRLHDHRAHLLLLISPDPTRPLFGPAATITFLPARADLDESPDFGELFHRAVGPEPEGQVLVLTSGGYPDASHADATKLAEQIRAESPSAPHRGAT